MVSSIQFKFTSQISLPKFSYNRKNTVQLYVSCQNIHAISPGSRYAHVSCIGYLDLINGRWFWFYSYELFCIDINRRLIKVYRRYNEATKSTRHPVIIQLHHWFSLHDVTPFKLTFNFILAKSHLLINYNVSVAKSFWRVAQSETARVPSSVKF